MTLFNPVSIKIFLVRLQHTRIFNLIYFLI